MKKLNIKNVEDMMNSCLFTEEEKTEETTNEEKTDNVTDDIKVVSVAGDEFRFDKSKLKEKEEDIYNMLLQLPEYFIKKGWAISMGFMRSDGSNWTSWDDEEHVNMLFALGLAIEKVVESESRGVWELLLGAPSYMVLT